MAYGFTVKKVNENEKKVGDVSGSKQLFAFSVL